MACKGAAPELGTTEDVITATEGTGKDGTKATLTVDATLMAAVTTTPADMTSSDRSAAGTPVPAQSPANRTRFE